MNTGTKTLGTKTSPVNASATTDADTFAVTVAFRNDTASTYTVKRSVLIQGVRGVTSANLVSQCGDLGANCTCDFYRTTSDTAPVAASSVGISSQNNSFSCSIPSSITDVQLDAYLINYVKLRRTDVTNKSTALLQIKKSTELTLDDVLGGLSKTKVRGIYRYSCNRTFFEGTGVNAAAGTITCTASQNLGIISAQYNYYTYRSQLDSNQKFTDAPFTGDNGICKRFDFLKVSCSGSTPDLRYGFYKEYGAPFTVAVTMTRAPEGDNTREIYGYAALPDSAGNCPTGLIKVRPYIAQPASFLQTATTPPSNFINSDNSLSNTVVEEAIPANFTVNRQPNATTCDATGDCTTATFGAAVTTSVAYLATTPIICAIPKTLISGLF